MNYQSADQDPPATLRLDEQAPYIHRELLAGRTVSASAIEDLPDEAAADVRELRRAGIRSVLAIPLTLVEEPVGALVLATRREQIEWTEDTLSSMRILANFIASVIAKADAEGRVRRQEEQNRAILASLPGFLMLIDENGQILRQSNRLGLNLAELPVPLREASPGRNAIELWRQAGESGIQIAETLSRVAKGSQDSGLEEHQYATHDGTRWVNVRTERLRSDQIGAVVSHFDITADKVAEREHAENRRSVWHLNRVASLSELTGSLAHELNQPLAGILSNAQAAAALLSRPVPNLTVAMEALNDIIDDDKRAASVISKMRSMIRKPDTSGDVADLNSSVEATLRLVDNEARLRHIALRSTLAVDVPPVKADTTQLQQVILNLVANGLDAVDSMSPGRRYVAISTRFVGGPREVVLEARDGGPGIPATKLNTVFEPFYTSKKEGLGLGLSICRSIVESFGGRITVHNSSQEGAIFRVSLQMMATAKLVTTEKAFRAGR